jgi:hypothetical protein
LRPFDVHFATVGWVYRRPNPQFKFSDGPLGGTRLLVAKERRISCSKFDRSKQKVCGDDGDGPVMSLGSTAIGQLQPCGKADVALDLIALIPSARTPSTLGSKHGHMTLTMV